MSEEGHLRGVGGARQTDSELSLAMQRSRKLSWHGKGRPAHAGHAEGGSWEGSEKSLPRASGDEAGYGVRSSRPAAVGGGKSEIGIGQFRNKARVIM